MSNSNKSKAPNYFVESVGKVLIPRRLSDIYLSENAQQLPTTIYTDMRVLTANKRTYNHTYYPEASLIGKEDDGTGLISFTRPYAIPIIKDHNTTAGPFGGSASEVYGRVFHPAQFMRMPKEGYVRAMATISHPEAVEGVLTGRWLTISLGSRTDIVNCSVCNIELTKGMCDHERGEDYDAEGGPIKAMWMIGPIKSKEISFVVSPSDDQAGVVTPHNTQFPTESEGTNNSQSFLSRILVENKHGIFDLVTGKSVESSTFFPYNRTTHKGFYFTGSPGFCETEKKVASVTEVQESRKTETKENQVNPAGFHGAGQYILGGGEHEHLVALDDRGYGNSGPAYKPTTADYSRNAPDSSTPATLPVDTGKPGGATNPPESDDGNLAGQPTPQMLVDRHMHDVSAGAVSPGEDGHVHNLIPKDVPDRRDPHENSESEDKILTFADLFLLPDTDPDASRTSMDTTEAVLTTKTRAALPTGAFCGPGRSFPAHDKAHVRAGMSYLDRSNLSPEQKSRTRACIIRKGRQLGMDMSGSQKKESYMYAARLTDIEHRVEIDLYPLPPNLEELDKIVGQVQSMPHTSEEKDQIMSRLAAHSKSIITTDEWQTRFGNVSICESGPPIPIKLTSENYGLIYAAVQSGLPISKSEGEDCECEKTDESVEEQDNTSTNEESTKESTEDSVEEKVEEKADSTKTQEESIGLEGKLSEALAHAVALYQIALRKSQTKGKTLDEVIGRLSNRSSESLSDTLSDLREEYSLQDPSLIPQLPRLSNPTVPSETSNATNSVEEKKEETQEKTEDRTAPTQMISISDMMAEEIEMDEDDDASRWIYRLYPEYRDTEKSV